MLLVPTNFPGKDVIEYMMSQYTIPAIEAETDAYYSCVKNMSGGVEEGGDDADIPVPLSEIKDKPLKSGKEEKKEKSDTATSVSSTSSPGSTTPFLFSSVLPSSSSSSPSMPNLSTLNLSSFTSPASVSTFVASSSSSSSSSCVSNPQKHLRSILSIDGEYPQVNCITENLSVRTKCEEKGIGVIKLAAGCSGKQQPNDAGPGFRIMKGHIRSKKFKWVKNAVSKQPPYMPRLSQVLNKYTNLIPSKKTLV